jgi:hypothetical protein
MNAIITILTGILLIILPIILIIGLISPRQILKWSTKPTRLKVIGVWILAVFIYMLGFGTLLSSVESKKTSSDIISAVRENLEKGQYSSTSQYNRAIDRLRKIQQNDSLYSEAQMLIEKTKNLRPLSNESIAELLQMRYAGVGKLSSPELFKFKGGEGIMPKKTLKPYLIVIIDKEDDKILLIKYSESKSISKHDFENIKTLIYAAKSCVERVKYNKSNSHISNIYEFKKYRVDFWLYDIENEKRWYNFIAPIVPVGIFKNKETNPKDIDISKNEIIEYIDAYIKEQENLN